MDKTNQTKKTAQKRVRAANVLEALKDVGNDTAKTLGQDVLKDTSQEFIKQLLGLRMPPKRTGEMQPGQEVSMDSVLSGKEEQNEKLRKQLSFERRLRQEESQMVEARQNNLKLQLHAVMQEMQAVAQSTSNLTQEVEIATMQAPANPGIYHIIFFEKLLLFIKSFRKKIGSAALWLGEANKRAKKKGFWAQYQMKKGQRLLSAEDYSGRSAG